MSAKQKRHDILKDIITTKKYSNVTALLPELNRQLRQLELPEVKQPTLSRDLFELNVTGGRGERISLPDKDAREARRVRLRRDLEPANLKLYSGLSPIVLKTQSGYAGLVALKLEEAFSDYVVASMCSNDVAVLYVESGSRRTVAKMIQEIIEDGE